MLSHVFKPSNWPVLALIASAAMLAGAHAFEHLGRMLPCPLCLRQREVYWAAIAVALGGLVVFKFWYSDRFVVTANMLLCLVFLVGAVIAGYHAGVEWNMWPGPGTCTFTPGDSFRAPDGGLDLDQKFSTVSCNEAPWRMLGISMAGYNTLISLGLACVSAGLAGRAIAQSRAAADQA